MLSFILKMDRKKLIFIILVIAMVARLGWISTLKYDNDYWGEEGCQEAAISLLDGKGYVLPQYYDYDGPPMYAWRVPMFSFFLAGTYFLFGRFNYLAAVILLAIMGVFTCLLIYFIGKIIFNEKVGIIACFVSAVFPSFIFWSGFLSPENLTIFLIALTMFFLAKSMEKASWPNYVFAGLFWGLAFLSRPQMLFFAPFFFIYILFASSSKKEGLKKFAVICVFMLIPVGAWTIRNYRIYHEFVPMETVVGEVLHVANNDNAIGNPAGFYHVVDPHTYFKGKTEVEVYRWYMNDAIRWIRANPLKYMGLVGDRFVRFWRFWPHVGAGITGKEYSWKHVLVSLVTIVPVILLGAAGIFLSLRQWRKTLLLSFLIFQFSFLTILGRVVLRYREPIMPYMIIFASYTLSLILKRIKNRAKQRA